MITVAGEQYYVIANSDSTKDYVVALKANPLTVDEINLYGGVGTENNHVNRYARNWQGTAYDYGDNNHSGALVYYSSPQCGYVNSSWVFSGCAINYDNSDIKYVVDNWALFKFANSDLKVVDGYRSRLAQKEELQPIGWPNCDLDEGWCEVESTTSSWLYNSSYYYWTMTQYSGSSSSMVWLIDYNGNLNYDHVSYATSGAVRPVINVYKSAIEN